MRCSRSDGTLIALPDASPGDDVAGAEIVAVGLDHQLAVGGAGGRRTSLTWREAGGGMVEREPRMRDRMRLDRDHLAGAPTWRASTSA